MKAAPAFLGLAILLAINLLFIVDIELTLRFNRAIQEEEGDWGFGQILAVLLLLLPLRDLVEAILARRLRQRQGELDEDLREAIESQAIDRVKRAIERGIDFPSPKSPDLHLKFWNVALTHGALDYFNDMRRIRMTIPEMALESDLHLAIEARNETRITAAYNRGADLLAGALYSADAAARVIWYSMHRGLDQIAQFHCRRPGLHVNKEGPDGLPALIRASSQGNELLVSILLENPAIDVNAKPGYDSRGETALISAARNGHEGIVRILLEREDTESNAVDWYRMSPLIWASYQGHEGITKLLLERQDINANAADEDGITPLICASRRGHEGVVRLLLQREDVQLNATTKAGNTPLICASERGHIKIVRILLDRADVQVDATNQDGRTAQDIASQRGHHAIAEMILAHCRRLSQRRTAMEVGPPGVGVEENKKSGSDCS